MMVKRRARRTGPKGPLPRPLDGPLGDTRSGAPSRLQWLLAGTAAFALHAAGAVPFLEDPEPPIIGVGPGDQGGIAIDLGPPPPPAPPAPEPEPEPDPEPEPEPEEEIIEEKSPEAPPPEPPEEPRPEPAPPPPPPEPPARDIQAGGGGDLTLEEYLSLADWVREARQAIVIRLTYPKEARRQKLTGSAVVTVTVTRRGGIDGWVLTQSTGSDLLDRAIGRALRAVRRLPAIPRSIPHDRLRFVVPIRFEIVYEE